MKPRLQTAYATNWQTVALDCGQLWSDGSSDEKNAIQEVLNNQSAAENLKNLMEEDKKAGCVGCTGKLPVKTNQGEFCYGGCG